MMGPAAKPACAEAAAELASATATRPLACQWARAALPGECSIQIANLRRTMAEVTKKGAQTPRYRDRYTLKIRVLQMQDAELMSLQQSAALWQPEANGD
jgi:hypothetical protein